MADRTDVEAVAREIHDAVKVPTYWNAEALLTILRRFEREVRAECRECAGWELDQAADHVERMGVTRGPEPPYHVSYAAESLRIRARNVRASETWPDETRHDNGGDDEG